MGLQQSLFGVVHILRCGGLVLDIIVMDILLRWTLILVYRLLGVVGGLRLDDECYINVLGAPMHL